MNLLRAELSRLLHRRALYVLLGAGAALTLLFTLLMLSNAPRTSEVPEYWADYATSYLGLVLGGAAGLSLLLGATYWGADFRHGTVGTLLTFVPDRPRVWGVRMLVTALGGLGFGLAQMLFGWLCVALFALARVSAFTDWGALGVLVTKGIGACVMAALLGGFLAVIFKNTAAAVVVPMAYLFVRLLFLIFSGLTGTGDHAQFLLPETYLGVYVAGDTVFSIEDPSAPDGYADVTVTFVQGLGVLLGLLAALGAVALALFDRRSVTE